MNIVAIIQARMGSTRMPKKVMQKIIDTPMIKILLDRVSESKKINKIIIATTTNHDDDLLANYLKRINYDIYRGDEINVLDRYYQVAEKENADVIVRITGDCPLVDAELIDQVISGFFDNGADYASNREPATYPDGLDVEVFTREVLQDAKKNAKTSYQKEHVTPYIINSNKYSKYYLTSEGGFSKERWTVDEPEDLLLVTEIFKYFYPKTNFSWKEVMKLRKIHPEIFKINQHIMRNEGAILGEGQKLWKRAKKIIPGGGMLLSKRAEMFLPEQWPAYFSKAKGCKVWDLDGREYIDMSIMGIGTNILGYGHPEVDASVQETVRSGNMSTLNSPEEVYLAEKLIEIHPWADMVRFARTGGEANAIAIRIARAACGKDKVAICGYHGWHDWYLSANLAEDDRLDGHLLPGLDAKGVPRNLKDTVLPFRYNNFAELETLIQNHDIGVIKMEVQRNAPPEDNFLQNVRKIATEKGIVLIFDECTSGFRETFGGLHKKYGVEPDIALFGKALGNGYAISAIIGRREVMEAAQSTFISSTFWTERIGPSAALKTLEVMEREESWKYITQTGLIIRKHWQHLADKNGLTLSNWGQLAMTGFTIQSENALAYKTLISQEMLYKGYLAGNSVYVSTEHKQNILDGYFQALEPIFMMIKECEEGRDVISLLKGPVCHGGFERLN
jgi:glutamate-1-semialdehyde 2,1-aminomutase